MTYLTCLHCKRKFPKPSRRRTCSTLCKNAVDKAAAQQRSADERHHAVNRREPVYQLTDLECLAIEARLAGSEILELGDFHGYSIKDGHKETASANGNELHDSWANRGADLDVWHLRRIDRARFGGIVMTAELASQIEFVRWMIQIREQLVCLFLFDPDKPNRKFDGLDSLAFHDKLFVFDLDEREIPAIVYNVSQMLPPNRKEIYVKLNDLARDSYLRRIYGITLVDYQRMLENQGGGCFGCGKTVQEEGIWLAVDHDHSSGAIRGVLCRACNTTLGFVRDASTTLRRLAVYLEQQAIAA